MKHRFLVSADAVADGEVIFSAEQAHQLQHVLRLRTGDRVRVFDGLEPLDQIVELVGPARGRSVGVCAQAPEPRTRLVVYPALLQRDKFEQVLQALTTLGVRAIVPTLTARALVRQMPDEQRLARWQAIVREAAEQCGRGVLPVLGPALPFEAAVAQAARTGRVVMAYEGERQATLHDALADTGPDVALFVGPEGGYAPAEVAHARSAGARLVTLGPRVLRTETASAVLAALVLYELGDLSSGPA
jgi:16S rRNA (uracil1498-N3)-methyltransferase